VVSGPVPKISLHDPTGDAFDSLGDPSNPLDDVTGAGMAQDSRGTAFAVTFKTTVNPRTQPTWLQGNAAVVWFVDTNRDDIPEYETYMFDNPDTGQLVAQVQALNATHPSCNAAFTLTAGVGYRLNAPAGCLPRMTSVRFQACAFFGGGPTDDTTAVDCAPDLDLSTPIVVNDTGRDGYWMLGADGRVYPFGGAVGFAGLVPGAVAMAPGRDGRGYWVTDFGGRVYAFGTARYFGGSPRLGAGESVSTISATPSGGGYWLFTNRGRVFPFGNASSFGDMSGTRLNGPIVASVATPSGRGYYLVGSDGGIFSFGDARFHGSTGGLRLHRPVVGIAPTPAGTGYWLVASDGGVFAFNAPFRGSMGAVRLAQPVDGLVAFGNGYLMAAADGGVFNFSNRAFAGSLAAHPPTAPIIGLAAFST